MASAVFPSFSFGGLARYLTSRRVEPELPHSVSWMFQPAGVSATHGPIETRGTHFDVETERREPTLAAGPSPRAATASHGTTPRAPLGTMLYLVPAGLVAAAIIGVFLGGGFLLLTPPAKESIAGSGARDRNLSHAAADAPRAGGEAAPVPQEAARPHSTPIIPAAIPAVPQRAAADEAPAPPRRDAADSPPSNPSGPAQIAPEAVPTSALPVPPTQAVPAPLATQNVGLLGDGTPRATQPEQSAAKPAGARVSGGQVRSAHHRTVHERRIFSAAGDRPHRDNLSASSGSLTPPRGGQSRSFDELLLQLTGQNQPTPQSLTPPRAEQPDPFAQRAWK